MFWDNFYRDNFYREGRRARRGAKNEPGGTAMSLQFPPSISSRPFAPLRAPSRPFAPLRAPSTFAVAVAVAR